MEDYLALTSRVDELFLDAKSTEHFWEIWLFAFLQRLRLGDWQHSSFLNKKLKPVALQKSKKPKQQLVNTRDFTTGKAIE